MNWWLWDDNRIPASVGYIVRIKKKIEHALQAVGMEGKKQCYVAELSDGERQKVMIAKALVQECPLILLDEPTAFLMW